MTGTYLGILDKVGRYLLDQRLQALKLIARRDVVRNDELAAVTFHYMINYTHVEYTMKTLLQYSLDFLFE